MRVGEVEARQGWPRDYIGQGRVTGVTHLG